jgi:2-methylcitrate dehydratase PrpD
MVFKLPIALSARNGIFAAELAGQGFAGVKDPFLGAHGFFKLYCRNTDTANITKDLGKRFYADAIIKPYSACRMTHSSIDSALKIACNNDYKVEDIKEIEVLLTPGTFQGFCSQPLPNGETPQVEAAFSIPYTVACALLRKGIKPDYFTEEAIHNPEIQSLIGKMKLAPGIPADKGMATEINVKLKDGRTLTASTDFPKGHYIKTPLTVEEIKAKFRNNVAYSKTVSSKKAEKALSIIEKLQDLKDVRELTELLVK